MSDYEGYSNSRNFDGTTTNVDREPSVYPFVSPHPTDPLGGGASGDMAFGTGSIVVDPSGSVTTRHKAPGIISGGGGISGGTP